MGLGLITAKYGRIKEYTLKIKKRCIKYIKMRVKKIICKTERRVYFTLTDKRTYYYKGNLANKKITHKIRIPRDKFIKEVDKIKKSKAK